MELTERQQAVYDGREGEAKSRGLKALVMYGGTSGAECMADITGEAGHLVTSFGLSAMKPAMPGDDLLAYVRDEDMIVMLDDRVMRVIR